MSFFRPIICLSIAVATAAVLIAFVVTTSMSLGSSAKETAFVAITGNATARFETIFQQSQLQLDILTALISFTDVDNDTFTQFLERLPGISSIDASFALALFAFVPNADVLAHEEAIRTQAGYSNYSIFSLPHAVSALPDFKAPFDVSDDYVFG
jgi:hypothetical protein